MAYRRVIRRKRRPMGPEHRIQLDIIAALTMHRCTVFRGNVGKIKMQDGRFFNTGLPNGFPDLFGWRWSDNQFYCIEVKAPKGRIRPDQLAFHQDLMHRKVIHGIARSVDDALKIVKEGLIGYGYPDVNKKEWL